MLQRRQAWKGRAQGEAVGIAGEYAEHHGGNQAVSGLGTDAPRGKIPHALIGGGAAGWDERLRDDTQYAGRPEYAGA